ncbi:ferrous iron transport protein B [Coprobacter secundus]|uniref:Ferrous iron transport protein B n=1 Tax=Coprobacter secundus subsp. similis TaxID=2751153 RepID=A0A7G1HV22_9BACT|nr:ferrous iron transport protein B [Coprobacter secundus]BCI62254.1 ferrous iron transport protein B [Coprobacter secundus subsp. similis]CCY35551.1 ferrous iron transporter B [Tannerella sp. CAG:118]
MRLSDLQTGEKAVIVKVLGHGAFRKRIIEMGFVRGQKVEVLLNAPLKDPIKYKIMGYEVSLRRSEAFMVEVISIDNLINTENTETTSTSIINDETVKQIVDRSAKTINIALVGNPNCGKTSLFNIASGAHEHVGNYSGVTVDAKKGYFNYKGYHFNIYDLPGTYSLSAYTPEEIYVRHHLSEEMPDVIVNVVVASNLERNLYLTTELIDMDISMVIALNMYDELEDSGNTLDYNTLGKMIGVPMVPTVSKNGKGIDKLFDTIINVYENQEPTVRHIHINHGPIIEEGITVLKNELKTDPRILKHFSPRYLAIKLLEGDKEIEILLHKEQNYDKWIAIRDKERIKIEKTLGEDVESAIANEKYGFISGALKETLTLGNKETARTTHLIDSLVTSKLFGFPIFIFIMWLMFEATFTVGAYPMSWIESGVGLLSEWVNSIMSPGPLKNLIIDGVIGGVGGVIVFLPNILILYFFISFMEDSGYMARAAFIMDKIMHKIGLHGKSFIPLIMGFGCNVPAIIATRTIESRSSRLITMLINPFMSCSARLPIYLLLVGTFFPNHASIVFLGLYFTGILLAIVTAKILRRFLFKKDETPFVMELPPYRLPTVKATFRHMWGKAEQYLRKMGGIILVASIIIWFLSYYPRTNVAPETITNTTEESMLQQKNSYIGQIGQFIEPVVEPLGFNWKVSIALISGTAAKELVVSTIGVLYSENDAEENMGPLSEKLKAINPETGQPDFTPLIAISFMVFVLLYLPCIASIVAIVKEAGSWRWGVFSIVYNTSIAWIVSFLVYNIGKLFI